MREGTNEMKNRGQVSTFDIKRLSRPLFNKVYKLCQMLRLDPATKGFTLLEVLVAVAILGIAVTIVIQLFSANVRTISLSEEYLFASAKAEAKMREILDNDEISETSFTEITDEGYRMDVSIAEVMNDRTENIQVKLLEINLTVYWTSGTREKSLTLRTMKVIEGSGLNI